MKSNSLFFLFTGIMIGAIGATMLNEREELKSRKKARKKSKGIQKAFKKSASKYREKLSGQAAK